MVDSVRLNPGKQRTKGLRLGHLGNQATQLLAGQDLDHSPEDFPIFHLVLEQGTELILGQHSDNIVNQAVKTASGSALRSSTRGY